MSGQFTFTRNQLFLSKFINTRMDAIFSELKTLIVLKRYVRYQTTWSTLNADVNSFGLAKNHTNLAPSCKRVVVTKTALLFI